MANKKKDIEYGEVELDKKDLEFSKGKIRITTMIDAAIYRALKKEAESTEAKYQTILNEILLNHYFAPKEVTKKGKVVYTNRAGEIEKRLSILEKLVLKKSS